MSSKLVSSLAKVYDTKATVGKVKSGKMSEDAEDSQAHSFNIIEVKIETLSDKMDKLIHLQGKVLNRLDGMSQEMVDIEQDVETLRMDREEVRVPPTPTKPQESKGTNQVKEMCREMTTMMTEVNHRSEQQGKKLDGIEKLILGIQEVINFIGEAVKSSQLTEVLLKKDSASSKEEAKDKDKQTIKKQGSIEKSESVLSKKAEKLKDQKGKDEKEKPGFSLKSLKLQKTPPDSTDTSSVKNQSLPQKDVQKLNQQNAERSGSLQTSESQDLEKGGKLEGSKVGVVTQFKTVEKDAKKQEVESPKMEVAKKKTKELDKPADVTPADSMKPTVSKTSKTLNTHPDGTAVNPIEKPRAVDPMLKRNEESKSAPSASSGAETVHSSEEASSGKSQVTEEVPESGDHNKHRRPEEEEKKGADEGEEEAAAEGEIEEEEAEEETAEAEPLEEEAEEAGELDKMALDIEEFKRLWLQRNEELQGQQSTLEEEEDPKFTLDVSHPPPAPFDHRIVAAKPNLINNFYTINKEEILGGGRFGLVHKCVENSSGLTLAAKIIKARTTKDKELVKNEIQVMNQLDHATLIQLYAAYESRFDIILVLEYVDGGELFDRIIDENYKLTELDSVHFIRQICEGVQHMHKMSIVHLDLKPENIMCVSRVTNKIKIIDFGLARMYKPREKLKVSFGTPEFLAPEVVSYDYVSFRTDMWSLGVITYMLLSSLSPFLGDDDNETLNNILACRWTLEEDEFIETSEEAKDFITKLLILNKGWRMNSNEALEHAWLSDPSLHFRLHRKKNMCRSRRSSCIPLMH